MKRIPLLVRIVLAIALGIIIGQFAPEILIEIAATFTGLFGNFLSFVIPLIILGFIAPGIASMGKGAGKMLGLTTGAPSSWVRPIRALRMRSSGTAEMATLTMTRGTADTNQILKSASSTSETILLPLIRGRQEPPTRARASPRRSIRLSSPMPISTRLISSPSCASRPIPAQA